MSKNYLIKPEFLIGAKKVIENWTLEEKAFNYSLLEKELNQIKKILREQLLQGTSKEINISINNINKIVKIIKGNEKIITNTRIIYNYEEAIKFAQKHNLHLPMTERIIIEPKIDISKLDSEKWFQDNIEQFVKKIEEQEVKKSPDRIIIVDKKG